MYNNDIAGHKNMSGKGREEYLKQTRLVVLST